MKLSEETKQELILTLLGIDQEKKSNADINNTSPMVGKVCMIRTYSAGVHFGKLVSKVGQNVVLNNAKRVFYWTEACSLSQLAVDGSLNNKGCKVSMAVKEIELDQVIEVIPMTAKAIENLSEHVWKK